MIFLFKRVFENTDSGEEGITTIRKNLSKSHIIQNYTVDRFKFIMYFMIDGIGGHRQTVPSKVSS